MKSYFKVPFKYWFSCTVKRSCEGRARWQLWASSLWDNLPKVNSTQCTFTTFLSSFRYLPGLQQCVLKVLIVATFEDSCKDLAESFPIANSIWKNTQFVFVSPPTIVQREYPVIRGDGEVMVHSHKGWQQRQHYHRDSPNWRQTLDSVFKYVRLINCFWELFHGISLLTWSFLLGM